MTTPAEQFAASKKSPTRANGRKIVWQCRLHDLRQKVGLTLRDVEQGTGISNATISQVERGMDVILSTAVVLAQFFGVTVQEMWPERAEE